MASLDTSTVLGNLTVSNKINAKKILSNKSVVISDDNAADHNLYRVMDLSSTLHLVDGGLQQQVINGKYVPYVLTKVIKNGDRSTTFECDHESEIVGGSNHDFGTITDETTMKITKVQGQTRRYSLNLLNLPDMAETTKNGVTCSVSNGVVKVKGTNTASSDVIFILAENMQFFGNDFSMDVGYDFTQLNNVNKFYVILSKTSYDSIMLFNFNNNIHGFATKNNLNEVSRLSVTIASGQEVDITLTPMLVSGIYTKDTMPAFQPYDDTLVNSKCNLVSTGRNLINLTNKNESANGVTLSITNNTLNINGTASVGSYFSIWEGEILLNGKYTFSLQNKSGSASGSNGMYPTLWLYKDGAYERAIGLFTEKTITITFDNYKLTKIGLGYSTSGQFSNFVANLMLNYGNQPVEYEPYIEEELPIGIELGAYDYIDVENDLIRRQTSKIFTLSGSSNENWGISPTVISGINRFSLDFSSIGASTSPGDEYAYIINASNWIDVTSNDTNTLNKCEGIAAQGNMFFIRKDDITTVTSLKSWLQSNPIQIVYKLKNYTDEPYKANQLLMATTNNTLALYNKYDIIKKENIKHDYGLMFEDNAVKNLVEAETIEISTSGTTEINLDELPIIDFVKVYAGKHFTKIEKTDPIIFSFKRVGGGMFGENDYIQLCQMSLYTYSDGTAKRKLRKLGETKIDSSANTTGLFDFSTTYNELVSMLAHNNAENAYYFRVCRKDDNTNFKHSNKIMKFIHINIKYVPNGAETSVSVQ